MKQQWMNLKVLLPTEVFLDTKAGKILAEANNGFFGLLPRHVDFVTALVPSIFTYWDENGDEVILAVDRGLLVKFGENVLVSTGNAIHSEDTEELQTLIDETFDQFEDRDRTARSAMAKMEADLVRRMVEYK